MVFLVPIKSICRASFLRHKLIFIIIGLLFIYIFCIYNRSNVHVDVDVDVDERKCFSDIDVDYKIEDILLSDRKPRKNETIFFHETTCNKPDSLNQITLNPRQACSIESAALLNPNFDIFVLFASPKILNNLTMTPILESILSYPNVHLRNVNLWTYAANTPIYEWFKNGDLFKSKYLYVHISDFIRYLTLWRWGGTHLDLDVIMQKSIEKIETNYAGAESHLYVNIGVLNFDHNGFGHEIADMCLRNFAAYFDGNDWGKNGPVLLTNALHTICKTKIIHLMTRSGCFGFKVFPYDVFYAIPYDYWKIFFQAEYLNETLEATKDSIAIHVWNKVSSDTPVTVGSKVAYGVLAEKYCPKVYKSCGLYF